MSPDLGILVIRMLLGIVMFMHGAQKLLGWFGGYGLDVTALFQEELGIRPGVGFAAAVGLSELTGGDVVTIVQNPTISVADDVAVTKRALARQNVSVRQR
jgi:putative oxidoreductase